MGHRWLAIVFDAPREVSFNEQATMAPKTGGMHMESDQFTEITHESWFSRLGNAVGGVVIGLILVAAATILLFWNEGRSVRRYQTLDAGQKAVISIAADSVDPHYEGRLVHLSGEVTTNKPLQDPEFGLNLTALRLQREV